MKMQMNLSQWCEDGVITRDDSDKFHEEAILFWKNTHKSAHRTTKQDISLNKTNACRCLDDIRKKDLFMLITRLSTDLSNGEFYYLANKRKIGWKKEWEKNY